MPLTQQQKTTLNILSVIVAAIYLIAGAVKLFGSEGAVLQILDFAFPERLSRIFGAVEVVGGVALLIPRFALTSASFLIILMIGAILAEIVNGGPFYVPLIVMFLTGGVAALRVEE